MSSPTSASSASKAILYSFFRSSASYRVRIALNLKGIPYEYRAVSLFDKQQHSSEYASLNPNKMVPTLLIDGHVLTQSRAIISYLEETRPKPSLFLADQPAHVRAYLNAMADVITSDVQPLQNTRVLNKIADEFIWKDSTKNERGFGGGIRAEWAKHWIAHGFAALEANLRKTAGKFSYGDSLSLIDVALVPQMYNARKFEMDLSAYPTLVRVTNALATIPEFERAKPENQPDFVEQTT